MERGTGKEQEGHIQKHTCRPTHPKREKYRKRKREKDVQGVKPFMALIWLLLLKALKGMVCFCDHRCNWKQDFGNLSFEWDETELGARYGLFAKGPWSCSESFQPTLGDWMTNKTEWGLQWSEPRSLSGAGQWTSAGFRTEKEGAMWGIIARKFGKVQGYSLLFPSSSVTAHVKKKKCMTKEKILIWTNEIHILFVTIPLKLYLVLVISVQIHCDRTETRFKLCSYLYLQSDPQILVRSLEPPWLWVTLGNFQTQVGSQCIL